MGLDLFDELFLLLYDTEWYSGGLTLGSITADIRRSPALTPFAAKSPFIVFLPYVGPTYN